jgi:predicted nucleotidyltransferase
MGEMAKRRHIDEPIVDQETFVRVLGQALHALESAGLEYLLMGGIASAVLGRNPWTHDIDVFTRLEDARPALAALAGAGFATQETFDDWLYKAIRERVLVDVIFRSRGSITVDDEMLARGRTAQFAGHRVRIIGPEDLVLIRALADGEASPAHFPDAVAVLARTPLDWEYFCRRAAGHPDRIASLLLYARSEGVGIPLDMVRWFLDQAG